MSQVTERSGWREERGEMACEEDKGLVRARWQEGAGGWGGEVGREL